MGKIFETVKSCLTNDEINFELNEDSTVFRTGFKTDAGSISARIVIQEEKEWFMAIGYFPNNIPVKFIDRLYPIINQLNRGAIYTYWCVDPEDGELAVRCGTTVDNGAISEEQVKVCLYSVVSAINSRYEEIMKEIYK